MGRRAGADHFEVGPFLQRRAIERQAFASREQFASREDKAVRAQSMRGHMAMLGLYVRQSARWFADLRAELLIGPRGCIGRVQRFEIRLSRVKDWKVGIGWRASAAYPSTAYLPTECRRKEWATSGSRLLPCTLEIVVCCNYSLPTGSATVL